MKVCILGSNGFIGKNLQRIDDNWVGITRKELDLLDQKAVDCFFDTNHWDVVIHCASVGGHRLEKDDSSVCYKNLLMFENVVRNISKIGRLIYFSSGASMRGSPPIDSYGFSKWIIDKRIASLGPNVHSLCIWGCYGPDELSTRFSAICKERGHVVIQKDRYFDFVDIEYVKKVVHEYSINGGLKFENLVEVGEKKLLSEWATKFGATFEILEKGLDEPYVSMTYGELKK